MDYKIDNQTGAVIPMAGCPIDVYNNALVRSYIKDAQFWDAKNCHHIAEVLRDKAKSLMA